VAFCFCSRYITISTLIYCVGFEWRFVDALYFVVVTLTTVGYGDHEALDQGEKAVTIFVVFIGVGLIGAALGCVRGETAPVRVLHRC